MALAQTVLPLLARALWTMPDAATKEQEPEISHEGSAPASAGSVSFAGAFETAGTDQLFIGVLEMTIDASPRLQLFVQLGFMGDWRSSGAGQDSMGMGNPVVGATYELPPFAPFRLHLTVGSTIPVGSGGGDDANPTVRDAMLSATDWGGPMFAPNHLDLFVGGKISYSSGVFGLRARSTFNEGIRVRGETVDVLGSNVMFVANALRGTVNLRKLSFFGEYLETRILNTPPFVRADPSARVSQYLGVGVSAQAGAIHKTALEPTLRFVRGIDQAKWDSGFQVIELGLTASF